MSVSIPPKINFPVAHGDMSVLLAGRHTNRNIFSVVFEEWRDIGNSSQDMYLHNHKDMITMVTVNISRCT